MCEEKLGGILRWEWREDGMRVLGIANEKWTTRPEGNIRCPHEESTFLRKGRRGKSQNWIVPTKP
jgi:hypothetical protein